METPHAENEKMINMMGEMVRLQKEPKLQELTKLPRVSVTMNGDGSGENIFYCKDLETCQVLTFQLNKQEKTIILQCMEEQEYNNQSYLIPGTEQQSVLTCKFHEF